MRTYGFQTVSHGRLAAEAAFASLQRGATPAASLSSYDDAVRQSFIHTDLHEVRDMRQVFGHGFFIGGGAEYALPWWRNLFWKTEYRYSEFDRANVVVNFTPAFAGGGPTGFTSTEKFREHSVRSELVYRFNWGGPLVAKY